MTHYSCEVCGACCTFEAMMMCPRLPDDELGECPVIRDLDNGLIVDRRPTDMDPNFPSEFTYAEK